MARPMGKRPLRRRLFLTLLQSWYLKVWRSKIVQLMEAQPFKLPENYDQLHLIEQLAADFSIEACPAKVEKVALYDTFDWRLYKKSLVLEGNGHHLRLHQLVDR